MSQQREPNLLPPKDAPQRPKDLDDGRAMREAAERMRNWNGQR